MKRNKAFTLVEIMIVVAIIAILLAVAVPGFIRARETTRTRAIQKDLVSIDDASRQYCIEYNIGVGDTMPTLDELVVLSFLRTMPNAPVRGHYEAATEFTELGASNPASYPIFVPDSGILNPQWVHPDLLP